MIRKVSYIFIISYILLLLCGCTGNTEAFQQPVSFYYPERVKEDGSITHVIGCEDREGIGFAGDLQLMLSSYLAGPDDPALYSPFPDNTVLIEASYSDGKVTLVFNESFSQLSSLDRSIACAGISRTCMAFTGADYVEIFAENTLFDGVDSILISADNLLTQDNTPIKEP